jgi:hypothetical protein
MAGSNVKPFLMQVPDDEEEMPAVTRIAILREVSKADLELFTYLLRVERVELDDQLQIVDILAPAHTPFELMWWELDGIIHVEKDAGGRLWVGKTKAMEELMRDPNEKRRRR